MWTGHTGGQEFSPQQRCQKSGQILLSSVSMRDALTCRLGGASWPLQCVLFVWARTHAFLQALSRATMQKKDDDDWRIWLGDPDFLSASDAIASCRIYTQKRTWLLQLLVLHTLFQMCVLLFTVVFLFCWSDVAT